MTTRSRETFPPLTMGHIRTHGVTRLLVYWNSCNHSATISGDALFDDVPVRSHGLYALRSGRCRCPTGLVADRKRAELERRATLRAVPLSGDRILHFSRCDRKRLIHSVDRASTAMRALQRKLLDTPFAMDNTDDA
jgi:hypothetical protein